MHHLLVKMHCPPTEVPLVLPGLLVMMEACMMEFSSRGLQLFSFIFKKGISSTIELNLSCYLCPLEGPLEFYQLLAQ